MTVTQAPQDDRLAERAGAGAAMRAVRMLFARLRVAEPDPAAFDVPDDLGPRQQPSREGELRERARLAHATVQVAGPAAVNVALDVVLAEFVALEDRARQQTEALKAIRLYGPVPWVRRIAEEGLAARRPSAAPAGAPRLMAADEAEEAELRVNAARSIG